MPKIKLAFVCVNYDGFSHTKKMLHSLNKQKNRIDCFSISVVVVDNSPVVDLRLVELCESLSHVRYIRSEKNQGYFAGLNLGLRNLKKESYEFIVVGNNDLEFESEFCVNLLKLFIEDRVQVICPNVVTKDGIHQNPHHLKPLSRIQIISFDSYFSSYYIGMTLLKLKRFFKNRKSRSLSAHNKMEGNIEVNQGVGACYILTKNFFKFHNELFFPSFLYGEEATLSWQVRNSGGCLVFNDKIGVLHAESASLSKLPAKKTYEYGRQSYWKIRKYLF